MEILEISNKQSERWQNIASIPEKLFEDHMKAVSEAREELTSAGFIKLSAELKQIEKRKNFKEQPLPNGKFQIILTDPPWEYRNSGFPISAENSG